MKKIFLAILLSFCCLSSAYAQDYYAMLSYKSNNDNFIIQLVKCPNQKLCKEILEKYGSDLDDKWKFYQGECLSGEENDKLFSSVFNKKPIPEPYIYYEDLNGLPNVIKFMDIAPPLDNVMINIWEKKLKLAGVRNIIVVKPNK
ncbi:MAG: hypothetical protein V1739_07990 [Candidatus Omnitrophota bacterium]